jgi:hypothetical protein
VCTLEVLACTYVYIVIYGKPLLLKFTRIADHGSYLALGMSAREVYLKVVPRTISAASKAEV